MPTEVNQAGYPFSTEFDDIFFADEDGLAESRYVFLGQNALPDRWAQSVDSFTIGELGFGTGLNFFATVDLWKKFSDLRKAKRLNYLSFEKYPLTAPTISAVMARWPELETIKNEFLSKYSGAPTNGLHRFEFKNENISLILAIGDAVDMLDQIPADLKIDAWFLDGFAPRKNPEMWSSEIFQKVVNISNDRATAATYTSAGWVKRNLQAAGFTVEKFKGFGRKRDMLKGIVDG
jgi:tRNA 5-methylaminomethyl-2-thiouridine biosynthesis bifunctional protein